MPLRRSRRARRRRRIIRASVLGGGGALLLLALLAHSVGRTRDDLSVTRAGLRTAQMAVQQGRLDSGRRDLHTAADRAQDARRRTGGVLWSLLTHVPGLGGTARELRGLSRAVAELSNDVVPPLLDAAGGAQGANGSETYTGRIDTAAVSRLAPVLQAADPRCARVDRELRALQHGGVGAVRSAHDELTATVDQLCRQLRDASAAAQVMPSLLGAHRPQKILVLSQNLAEARATGGLVAAYALLTADDGRITVDNTGGDLDLADAPRPVIDLGAEFDQRYAPLGALQGWRSANLTPDVPSAGAILGALARSVYAVHLDAVVFADPVSLARLLDATGPVPLPGLPDVTGANATTFLLHDIYERFPRVDQKGYRSAINQRVLHGVIDKLRTRGGSLRGMLTAFRDSAADGHLSVWAADSRLEAVLGTARLGGALPRTGPLLSVVTQDAGGSKLDYYVQRDVSYVATARHFGATGRLEESATVTITLTSKAPASGLPRYVTYRADLPDGRVDPPGQQLSLIGVYLGPGARFTDALLDGRPAGLAQGTEKGLTVISGSLTLDPGQSRTLVLHVVQPATGFETLSWRQQPRLEPDHLSVRRAGGYVTDLG